MELSLVLPLLLVLLAGIVDYALLFRDYEIVSNAAREGARMGVLPGFTNVDVQNRVTAYLIGSGLSGTPTTIVGPVAVAPGGGGATFPAVQVQVSYPHAFTLLGPMLRLLGTTTFASVTLRATSTMRSESVVGS